VASEAEAAQPRLRDAARDALFRAYAPYSGFPVAAAVLGESGRVYVGVNVENASYGLTICAERAAVVRAVAEGERRLLACATTSARGSSSPCGACRQVLAEFLGPDAPVFYTVDGEARTIDMAGLLPAAFHLEEQR
jgi:cytidine deaminase